MTTEQKEQTEPNYKLMAAVLLGLSEGMLQVLNKHDIEISDVEFEIGDETITNKAENIIAMCRKQLGITGTVTTEDTTNQGEAQ